MILWRVSIWLFVGLMYDNECRIIRSYTRHQPAIRLIWHGYQASRAASKQVDGQLRAVARLEARPQNEDNRSNISSTSAPIATAAAIANQRLERLWAIIEGESLASSPPFGIN